MKTKPKTPDAIPMPAPWQCFYCRWHGPGSDSCFAFPDGIPDEIWDGTFDHVQHHPAEQHGVTFEPLPGFEAKAAETRRIAFESEPGD